MKDIILITAMGFNNEIGKDNNLLCKLKDDMRLFRSMTEGEIVVMGRKTFESIGRPLPNRTNIVLSRDREFKPEGVIVLNSVKAVFEWLALAKRLGDVYVIGGAEVYKQFFPHATGLVISRIEAFFDDADAHFPAIDWDEWEHHSSTRYYESDENNDYPFISHSFYRKEGQSD